MKPTLVEHFAKELLLAARRAHRWVKECEAHHPFSPKLAGLRRRRGPSERDK